MTAGRMINTSSQNWCTPKKYVDVVKDFFGGTIDLDPCSNNDSIVGATEGYALPQQDGLRESWKFKRIYVNPPYGIDKTRGTSIRDWIERCCESNAKYGSEVLALIPVATNTGHWKRYIFGHANSVCFLDDTRLKFLIHGNGEGKGAPMACAMVYWGKNTENFYCFFQKYGAVVDLANLRVKKWTPPNLKKQNTLFSVLD